MGIGIIFQKNRPKGFIGKGDKYIPRLSEDLYKILSKEIKSLTYDTLGLAKDKLLELSIHIIEFAEDIHNDLGFWSNYEDFNIEYFGIKYPLYSSLDDKLHKDKFNIDRIRHFLSFLYEEIKPDLILSPAHREIEHLSKIISNFLNEKLKMIPKGSGIQQFLSHSNNEAGDVKRKLIWLGTKSYLFRLSFNNYIKEKDTERSIGLIDDFICQENTKLSGLGVIDILSKTLKITDRQKNDLRSWYERHFAFYEVLSNTGTTIDVINLINDEKYSINTGDYSSQFKINEVILGGLIPWDNMWYWSGEQKLLGILTNDQINDIKKDFLKTNSKIVYRYNKKMLFKANERVKEHYDDFVKYFGDDLVIFSDGLEMAAEMQKKERLKYESRMSKEELEIFMKKHDLKNPSPNYTYPEPLMETSNGIGVYFNPDEGQEIAVDFNNIINGFKKQGENLNEDEENAIRLFIESNSISPNFVKRMINDYGNKSILSSFIIREYNKEIALEYILRKYKGHFYRNRYPSISFID